jgi:pyruvate dehydrogenase E2 component (dihydrolipoamide acetyltransferase)
MAVMIPMPKVGISVETCIITEWLKQPGDTVSVGEILFTYETDKASLECESPEAGTLLAQFYQNGDEVVVLENVCAVGAPGEDVSGLKAAAPAAAEQAAPAKPAESAPQAAAVAVAAPLNTGDVKISPRAKHLAQSQHMDYRMAQATGPYGRVIERDVRGLIESGQGAYTSAAYGQGEAGNATGIGGRISTADLGDTVIGGAEGPATVIYTKDDAPEYEDKAFTGIRRAISKSMSLSLNTIPQLTHNHSFDATAIMAYRATVKAGRESLGLPDISLGDMVLFAVSRLLPKYPELNAHMLDANNIRLFKDVHLGVAVDTPRGLMVPKIRFANRRSLAEISSEVKRLAAAARDGSISPDELAGGTFTVSNLGNLGVESFTPVINPPETGILGVDTITQRPKLVNGAVTLYPVMGLSLTYDHRAIDGAPASRFASELCKLLEQFGLLLAQ